MPPLHGRPHSPQEYESEPGTNAHRRRHSKSPLASLSQPHSRRSSALLSDLFASTTSLPNLSRLGSPAVSGTVTSTVASANGAAFSPTGPRSVISPSPALSGKVSGNNFKDLVLRAFSPHVSVLASQDTEELFRHKGISGGLLELLRPFGEHISGKVTVRDSTGVSRSWEDFAVRFTGVKDGLENPRTTDRRSTDSHGGRTGKRMSLMEFKPARLRTGGDVSQVEELVERHLTFAEEYSGPIEEYVTAKDIVPPERSANSPFYSLYLRRLLSGLPMVPSETFSHPVAAVIAISSRSPSPIEELRSLYDSSNSGEYRLPQWIHNEFLRYYVLIHDEDYDDITKSMALYDQMKRHFGLHCHLLRLRSTQCVASDDDSVRLQNCEWMSAAEELDEITRRETTEDEKESTAYIFESDASAVRAFVREMVTQSIIPSMERASATWNDQVASRRRGLSGRFMSLSKRFTTFGNRNSSGAMLAGTSSNYDGLQGFYRPDAPEAVMRKLADYAIMLRDFRLSHSTYEILCQDYKHDKAWRYYAGANEMAAVSLLLATEPNNKIRIEGIDQYLEAAYYSYITRASAPYYALRTLLLGVELLKIRGGNALDDAARWLTRIADDRLVGPVGHVLLMERTGSCFNERRNIGGLPGIDRHRKAAFWNMLAAEAWSRAGKIAQAERCLSEAMRLYGFGEGENQAGFGNMARFLLSLQEGVSANHGGVHHIDGEALLNNEIVEPIQEASEQLDQLSSTLAGARAHRKSMSTGGFPSIPLPIMDTVGTIPSAYESSTHATTSLNPSFERNERRDDGFE